MDYLITGVSLCVLELVVTRQGYWSSLVFMFASFDHAPVMSLLERLLNMHQSYASFLDAGSLVQHQPKR